MPCGKSHSAVGRVPQVYILNRAPLVAILVGNAAGEPGATARGRGRPARRKRAAATREGARSSGASPRAWPSGASSEWRELRAAEAAAAHESPAAAEPLARDEAALRYALRLCQSVADHARQQLSLRPHDRQLMNARDAALEHAEAYPRIAETLGALRWVERDED